MDTNSNIPADKKVVSVEILHLDELGYGPQGKHTRREWRKECLENLLSGKAQFEAWQESWKNQITENLEQMNFGVVTTYADGSKNKVLDGIWGDRTPHALDFVGHIFNSCLDCKNFIFKQRLLFAGVTFNDIADFESTIFREITEYEHAAFNGIGIFLSSEFNDVSFVCSKFNEVNFNNTVFSNHYVNFDDSIFKSKVDFEGSRFPTNFMNFLSISFINTEFRNHAAFRNLTFGVKTNFTNAKFTTVDFENTKFNHKISFESVRFGGNDSSNRPFPRINFINTEFIYDAQFNRAIFSFPTDFIKAKFYGDAEFNNVTFNDDIRLFGTKFEGGVFFNDAVFTGNAVKRLGQMKRMAEDNGQTDQALNFNALELDAKRAQAKIKTKHLNLLQKLGNGDVWLAWTTYAYDKLSNYGRSFTRPLLAYGVLMFATYILALGHGLWASIDACPREGWNVYEQLYRDQAICPVVATLGEQKIPLTVPRAAFEYNAYRASGVLDFVDTDKQTIAVANRLFNQPIEPMWMRIWGVVKAIASVALLFLAALGLRNKYRIK